MATSGSFTGARGGSGTGPYLKLEWSRIDIDNAGNRSKLRLTLKLVSDYSINFSADKTGNLEGTSFTYTNGMSGAGTITVKTKDMWVNHNSDGSKSITLDGDLDIKIYWSGVYVNELTVSGTATLDDIPRESAFTAFSLSNSVLNTSTSTTINYTLDKYATGFSHAMTLKYGRETIASWTTSSEGALTRTLSSTEVNKIISSMSTVTSGTLTLTMQTKDGTTNIGSSVSRTTSISLNSAIVPTASGLTAAIFGSGRDKTINKYVQSISKVTASFTSGAGYGATITSQYITVKRQSDNGNSQTISGTSGTTTNPVSLSGTYIVVAYVKDSRGRTKTISTTITVDAYSPPVITTFSTVRSSTASTTVNAAINTSWSLATSNPTDITIVGVNNTGVSSTLYSLVDSTAGSLNTTQSYAGQSDASSYTYTITVTDSFGKQAKAISTVGTSFVELTISKGFGIGVGKVHEQGALDVGGQVFISGVGTTIAGATFGNGWIQLTDDGVSGLSIDPNEIYFGGMTGNIGTIGDHPLHFSPNGVYKMAIKSDGTVHVNDRMSIGTSHQEPGIPLVVNGDMFLYGVGRAVHFNKATGTVAKIQDEGSGQLGFYSDDMFIFYESDANTKVAHVSGNTGEFWVKGDVTMNGGALTNFNMGNSDVEFLKFGSGSTGSYGYSFMYQGTGTGASNSFVIRSSNSGSGDPTTKVFELLQDGSIEAQGRFSAAGAYNHTTTAGANCYISSSGAFMRSSSSIKYKKDVEDMWYEEAEKVVNGLRPVYYRPLNVPEEDYHPEWSHFGLIAEEVTNIDPRLVHYKKIVNVDGTEVFEPEGVQYDRLAVYLLPILKKHEKRIMELETKLLTAG